MPQFPCRLIICPGIHPPQLTQSFIQQLQLDRLITAQDRLLVLPTAEYPPYWAVGINHWLNQNLSAPQTEVPLTFITFSAGVVGGIGAALTWQIRGGKIKAFIAIDGWGVPLLATFPIYRLSHDYFTHWSSALLGGGDSSFYCEPTVEHLDLWRSPATVWGWQEISEKVSSESNTGTDNFLRRGSLAPHVPACQPSQNKKIRCSAAEYLQNLLTHD